MSNIRTIGQITTYRPVGSLNIEELAAYQQSIEARGGIAFARAGDREQKEAARDRILDLFTPAAWPRSLRMLTMPGMAWRFERLLLGSREPGWMNQLDHPRRTHLVGIENDRAIYHAALTKMPGLESKGALVKAKEPPVFAMYALKTKFIKRFYFGNVDDLMKEPPLVYDAAWLDYTGPMTAERLKLISTFYGRSVRKVLIVTAMKARWNRQTSDAITRAGGYFPWLQKHLPGEVIHELEYADGAPMAQFAVRHPEMS